MKTKRNKADFTLKSGKLFLAQQRGLKDVEASKEAGILPNNVLNLERTKNYQNCQKKFKDALLENITIEKLAKETIKNIEQDIDKGAKNNAIKMAVDRIEPDKSIEQAQQVNIVLR